MGAIANMNRPNQGSELRAWDGHFRLHRSLIEKPEVTKRVDAAA